MSGASIISFDRGLTIARELMVLLNGTIVRIAVAGSLRRGKESVGDVELVLAPAFDGTVNLFERQCEYLLGSQLEKRLNRNGQIMAWGKPNESSRYKAALYHQIPVDLFIVLPDRQWGPTMLIRTGPGMANSVLVTTTGITNHDGNPGILPKGMAFEGGRVTRNGVALDTPEEEDVFAACALPWLPPGVRSVEKYQEWSDPDWPGAYRKSYAYSQWHDAQGWGVPLDAIDREGVPMWLDEQLQCLAPMTMARPVEQLDLFGGG